MKNERLGEWSKETVIALLKFVCLLDLMMLTQSEEWVHVGFSEDIAMARVGVLAMSESKSGQKWERVYLNSQD